MKNKHFSNQQIKFIVILLASSIILAFLILVLIERMFFLPGGISYPFDSKNPRKTPKVFLEMKISTDQVPNSKILPVSIYLDTQGKKVDGVGIDILYDPNFLEIDASGIITESPELAKVIFPVKEAPQGELKFSLISSINRYFEGKGKIATLNFKVLQEGVTDLNFRFRPGATDDCNVVLYKKGIDILEEVKGGGEILLTYDKKEI